MVVSQVSSVRRRQRLASVGLSGIATFVLSLVALHATALRDEPSHMSQFANSQFALFWVFAIYSFILGTSLLIWALKPCLRACRSKRAGLVLLWLAGLGAIVLAAFPTDAVYPLTIRGIIHDNAALMTFVLLGAAMVVLAPAFRASPDFAAFARTSLVLGILVTVSWMVYLATTLGDMAVRGPVQRVLVGLIVAWFTMLALRIRRLSDDSPTDVPGPSAAIHQRVVRARTAAIRRKA